MSFNRTRDGSRPCPAAPRPLLLRAAMAVCLLATVPVTASLRSQAQSTSQFTQSPNMSQVAKGEFTVKLQPLPLEGQPAGSKIARMSIDKTITGDLVATTAGQMLSAMTDVKGSAGYVALERVEGVLHGRRGTFVLQHTGTMNKGAPSLSVTVVPDSGTDQLVGLSGQFNIVIAGGKHSYEFTYALP